MIWEKKNGHWVQALHCLFVVGMLLAPLISRPFLSHETNDDNNTGAMENKTALQEETNNVTSVSKNLGLTKDDVNLMYPYLITGILTLVSSVIFLLAMLSTKESGLRRMIFTDKRRQENSKVSSQNQNTDDKIMKKRKLQLTLLVLFFIFAFCTAEVLYGVFLVTFIVQFVGLDKQDAALVASVFFFVTIASRAAGIFIITKVKPVLLIFFGMSLTIISAVLFYLVNEHIVILWVASCLAAWGSATQYPSTLTWVSEYTEVKGYVGTTLLVSNAVGYFIGPLSLGLLFKAYEISSFLYVLTTSLCLKFIAYTAINVFLKYCWNNNNNCDVEMDEIATNGVLLEVENKV